MKRFLLYLVNMAETTPPKKIVRVELFGCVCNNLESEELQISDINFLRFSRASNRS